MPRQNLIAFRPESVDRVLAGESVLSHVAGFGFPSRRCTGGRRKGGWVPGSRRGLTERSVAEADSGRGEGHWRQARRRTHRVPASQGLGDV